MGLPVLDEILTFLQNIVTWFVQSAPTWVKTIISLFFVIFVANLIVPVFTGFFFACNSNNNLYKLNSVFGGVEVMTYKMFADLPTNSSVDYTDVVNRTQDQKSFMDWFIRFLPCDLGYNYTQCSKGRLDYWRYQHPSNYSEQAVYDFNLFVSTRGNLYDVGSMILTPKCEATNTKLYFMNQVDLFDYRLWILITMVGFLVSFAFKWYQVTGIH